MNVLKRKDFARWQAGERLPDAALCKAVHEMEDGLIDAHLGGLLYKKRVARPGGGKSGNIEHCYQHALAAATCFCMAFLKMTRRTSRRTRERHCSSSGRCFWSYRQMT